MKALNAFDLLMEKTIEIIRPGRHVQRKKKDQLKNLVEERKKLNLCIKAKIYEKNRNRTQCI